MKKHLIVVIGSLLAASVTVASADNTKSKPKDIVNPNVAPLSITNTISTVDGHVGGFVDANGNVNGDMMNPNNVTILYPITGIVRATVTDGYTGESLGGYNQIGTIAATVNFPTTFFGLMGDWSALPATMPWTMQNDFALKVAGSTLKIAQGEELTGRAFPHLGPVENPMAPETATYPGTMSLRMAGCMGVREVSGLGDYAGKVGTLCLNGTFSFDQQFNGKGVSNCTVALHNPLVAQ